MIEDFALNGTMGTTVGTYGLLTNAIPMLGLSTPSVSATLGSKAITSFSFVDQHFGYLVTIGNLGGVTTDNYTYMARNANGRFAWSNLISNQAFSTWGGDIGFRCVGTAP